MTMGFSAAWLMELVRRLSTRRNATDIAVLVSTREQYTSPEEESKA